MISIIVSSQNRELYAQLQDNIKKSVGVVYEIICIENANGKYGLCETYNMGATQAKFNFLCFMHEDLIFKTADWGIIICDILKDATVGVLGLAGSIYKSHIVHGWPQIQIGEKEADRVNVIQHYKHQDMLPAKLYVNPNRELIAHVITLDGMFLACTATTWHQTKFDQELLPSFHGYDLDFSLHVALTKNNFVLFNIVVEHLSDGMPGSGWYLANLKIHQKYRLHLPMFTAGATSEKANYPNHYSIKENKECSAVLQYVLCLKKEGVTRMQRLNLVFKSFRYVSSLPFSTNSFKIFVKIVWAVFT